MAEKAGVRFRGLLTCLGCKLTLEEAKAMAVIYLEKENICDLKTGIEVMERIIKRKKLRNCTDDLEQLKRSLNYSGRSDLIDDVKIYMEENPWLPEHAIEHMYRASTSTGSQENESDFSKSTFTGGIAG